MRYNITEGVINYFKSFVSNVIYVADVDEAFREFNKQSKDNPNKSPFLLAISRKNCDVTPRAVNELNRIRGRVQRLPNPKNGSINEINRLSAMEVIVYFDITVLAYDNYTMDTAIDELYWYITDNKTYRYYTGARRNDNNQEELIAEGNIILENSDFGEFSEVVNTEDTGRIYRTTFSFITEGRIYRAESTKIAKTIPITAETISKSTTKK